MTDDPRFYADPLLARFGVEPSPPRLPIEHVDELGDPDRRTVSPRVSLHAALLSYDVVSDDGSNVGRNHDGTVGTLPVGGHGEHGEESGFRQVGSLKLTPTVSVALEQTLDDGDESVSTRLGFGPSVINTVDGGDESVVVVGAGVGFDGSGSVTGTIGYQGSLLRDDGSDHAVDGRLRLHF